ncbi:MAG: hypothetical protein ACOYN0_19165, partial [Phycisphaerales bacterium]
RATAEGVGGATGNIHFSAVALVQNRRGIADALRAGPYAQPALIPASPWLAREPVPAAPQVSISPAPGETVRITLTPGTGAKPRRWVIWARYGETWRMAMTEASKEVPLRSRTSAGELNAVAASAADAFWRTSAPTVLTRP